MNTEVKTSIQISVELLKKVEKIAEGENARSEFLERAVSELIDKLEKQQRNEKDIELINQNADELNAEAMDVLDFQFDW